MTQVPTTGAARRTRMPPSALLPPPVRPCAPSEAPGLSVVIPVHNGARFLPAVLAAIEGQRYHGPLEILAVDDGSTDASGDLLRAREVRGELRVIQGPGRGAAAALNAGLAAAVHPLIAQIDQDVIIGEGWLAELTGAFDEPQIGAAQGHYVARAGADVWSRVMALDLRQRYAALPEGHTNHVCTGNSIYRASALVEAGLFDEELGYGYDNDISYRLDRHGYRLLIRPRAESVHLWREGLLNYARQQYGFGYGRIDLVSRHRTRVTGDSVSPWLMMIHAPATFGGLALLGLAAVMPVAGSSWQGLALTGGGLLVALCTERAVAGVRAAARHRDAAGLLFVPVHLVRDLAWSAAIVVWIVRRVLGRPPYPQHSMAPRTAEGPVRR
jgi:cellulose synthase/poly-beta-1,6-N-acetylglucosamine synthase-like glycosyltransferase